MVAGFSSLALACAGCLVTNELDFQGNLNSPSGTPISPPPFSAAPSKGSDECTQLNFPDSLAFQADYYDRDVDQKLFVIPFVNGSDLPPPIRYFEVAPSPNGTPEHQHTVVCIPRSRLGQPCNRVQLFISDDVAASNRRPDELLQDPEIDSIVWFVSPSAGDTPGNPGLPNTGFADCLPPDGGV